MHNLFRNVVVGLCSTDIAAGATTQGTTAVDTRGYGGVAFMATFGTISTAATNSLHAEMAGTTTETFIDVEASNTTGGGDTPGDAQGGICFIDLGRPVKRFYRAVVNRATANTVINGVHVFLYNPEAAAVTQSTAAGFLVRGSTYLYYATTGASTGS